MLFTARTNKANSEHEVDGRYFYMYVEVTGGIMKADRTKKWNKAMSYKKKKLHNIFSGRGTARETTGPNAGRLGLHFVRRSMYCWLCLAERQCRYFCHVSPWLGNNQSACRMLTKWLKHSSKHSNKTVHKEWLAWKAILRWLGMGHTCKK